MRFHTIFLIVFLLSSCMFNPGIGAEEHIHLTNYPVKIKSIDTSGKYGHVTFLVTYKGKEYVVEARNNFVVPADQEIAVTVDIYKYRIKHDVDNMYDDEQSLRIIITP